MRKISDPEADSWDLEIAPFVLDALLDRVARDDRRGLTRIDRPGAAGGEHAWRARVYGRDISRPGREQHRQFADSLYGGAEGALRAALEWRDAQRAALPPSQPRPPRQWRIVRADYQRNSGWLAYAD